LLKVYAAPRHGALGQPHGRGELAFRHQPINGGSTKARECDDRSHANKRGWWRFGSAWLGLGLHLGHQGPPRLIRRTTLDAARAVVTDDFAPQSIVLPKAVASLKTIDEVPFVLTVWLRAVAKICANR
jgi:hypothetical protein